MRAPALGLGSGVPLIENTAILPYLGRRVGLWPTDPLAEARALAVIGFFAASVHPAHAQIARPERYTDDSAGLAGIQAKGRDTFFGYLAQIDAMLAGRQWLDERYSVLDAYAFVFFNWGVFRQLPMPRLAHYAAHAQRMRSRPAVQCVLAREQA
jgi:glutathione S-transferase